MIEFTIPGSPVPKGRPRFARVGGFVRAYTPRATSDAEQAIAECAQRHLNGPMSGSLRVEVLCLLPIPKSLPKAAKRDALLGRVRPAKKPDADNLAKLVLDGLNGVAWDDDSQIVELEVRKFYALEPRTVVKIVPV